MKRARKRSRRPRAWLRRVTLLLALFGGIAASGLVWLQFRERARERRLDALERTRDDLRARLAVLRAKDAVAASAPPGDVVIGVPEAVVGDLIRQAAAAFLSRVEIDLRDVEIHRTGRVRVRTAVGHVTPGFYDLDVRIHELRAVLEPGTPQVSLRGPQIQVEAPVRLAHGEGRGGLRLRWDSRGLARAFCPDFESRLRVAGTVVPRSYAVSGRLSGDVAEGALTATPSFPDLRVNVRVEPSADSWRALDRLLGERPRRCRAVLGLADVPGQVRRALERGIDVLVPRTVIRPLRFPARLQRVLTREGHETRLRLEPRRMEVTPQMVWYGADLTTDDASRAGSAGLGEPSAQPAPEPSATTLPPPAPPSPSPAAPTPAPEPAAAPRLAPEPAPEGVPSEAPPRGRDPAALSAAPIEGRAQSSR